MAFYRLSWKKDLMNSKVDSAIFLKARLLSVPYPKYGKTWECHTFIPKPGITTHSKPKDFRPISLPPFLLETLVRLFDFYIKDVIVQYSRNNEGATHTESFHKSIPNDWSDVLINRGRSHLKRVLEIITNHCGLNKHLHNIGLTADPKCPCGLADETGIHIISECPLYT